MQYYSPATRHAYMGAGEEGLAPPPPLGGGAVVGGYKLKIAAI